MISSLTSVGSPRAVLFPSLSLIDLISSLVFFFFSSRRRHTRCLSDWSSDVCSSDLPYLAELLTRFARTENLYPRGTSLPRLETVVDMLLEAGTAWDGSYFQPEHRSEERRVGKECRSRWWPDE